MKEKSNYIILHEHLSSSQPTYQQYCNASFFLFIILTISFSVILHMSISFHIMHQKCVCNFMKSAFFPFYSDSFSSLLIKQIVSCIKYSAIYTYTSTYIKFYECTVFFLNRQSNDLYGALYMLFYHWM